MSTAAAPDRWLSPPAIGRMLGVDPAKIVALIKRCEIEANNVAFNPLGRPRYRISPEALDRWLKSRSTAPTPKKPTRTRRATFQRKYYT